MNTKVIVSAFVAGVAFAGLSVHAQAQSARTTNDAGANITFGRRTIVIRKKSQRAAAFGHRAQVGHAVRFQPATCSTGRVNAAGTGCVEPGATFEPQRAARITAANNGTAIGAYAHASGQGSSAFGSGAQVVRVATPARAASCASGALKPSKRGCVDKDAVFTPARSATTVAVQNGTAIGAGALVRHNDSVALGAGARTTRANQIVLGTRNQGVTAPGINSQASRNAQAGRIGIVTSDRNGNLANSEALADTIKRNEAGVAANRASNERIFQELEKHARGIAIATAMPDAHLNQSENFVIAGNVGGYGSETAFGFGGAVRIDEHLSMSLSMATDTGFKDTGWKVGGRVGW